MGPRIHNKLTLYFCNNGAGIRSALGV